MPPTAATETRRPARDARRPAFLADWAEATFVHFAMDPRVLQPLIPFPLDLYQAEAYVSLVAFTMRRMRPAWLDSAAGELLLRPIAPCRFLNVRTYVRGGVESGIYFMGEWLSHWGSIPLGPMLYGLPYHAGRLRFTRDSAGRETRTEVRSLRGQWLAFRGESAAPFAMAMPGSLDAFLLERYLAFTQRRGQPITFRVEHEPWSAAPADITLEETALLRTTGSWFDQARLIGGHVTPGARDVRMGAPVPLTAPSRASRSAFCA